MVYFLIESSLNRSELQQQIVLDSDEVDAFAWLNNLAIEAVLGDKEDSIEKVEYVNFIALLHICRRTGMSSIT